MQHDIRFKDTIDKQESSSTRTNLALIIFTLVVAGIAFIILFKLGCVSTSYYCQI